MKYQANVDIPLEQMLSRFGGSIYKLVITVGKRAQEIAEGSPLLIEGGYRKPMVAAMMEALAGKLSYRGIEASAKGRRRKK